MYCYFSSDLHGSIHRYSQLFKTIAKTPPDAVFLAGDLLPKIPPEHSTVDSFLQMYLFDPMIEAKQQHPTDFFIIMGNDDLRIYEQCFIDAEQKGILHYIQQKTVLFNEYQITGYSYVPPTPFSLKDWERYDVSRYLDPGCIAPKDGKRSVEIDAETLQWRTIQDDIEELTKDLLMDRSIFLFHSPPYGTKLDVADFGGKSVDHAPLDPHVGSIAIQRFIKKNQPLLTLHGHIHESTRLTGSYKDMIGSTTCINGAHDGPELSLIRFNLQDLTTIHRELL